MLKMMKKATKRIFFIVFSLILIVYLTGCIQNKNEKINEREPSQNANPRKSSEEIKEEFDKNLEKVRVLAEEVPEPLQPNSLEPITLSADYLAISNKSLLKIAVIKDTNEVTPIISCYDIPPEDLIAVLGKIEPRNKYDGNVFLFLATFEISSKISKGDYVCAVQSNSRIKEFTISII